MSLSPDFETDVLVVGTGEIVQAIADKMTSSPDWGYQVLGYVGEESQDAAPVNQPRLGGFDDLDRLVRQLQVNEVILADPGLSHARIVDLVQRLDYPGLSIKVFPDVFQLISTQVTISDLHGMPLVSVRDAALRGWRSALKRVVDVLVSGTVLVFASPVLLFLALLVKLSSPGPVFYAQERVGLNGKSFWVLKFRSMYLDRQDVSGAQRTTRGDPRVTPLGRIIRPDEIAAAVRFALLEDTTLTGQVLSPNGGAVL